MAQKNADYKLIAKKKIKEIKAVNMLIKETYEDGIYYNDSVFVSLYYDKKGRLIEYKDSIKRFLNQKLLGTNIFTQQFDSLGDNSFSLSTSISDEKYNILDTAHISIYRGYLGLGYMYNFFKTKDTESKKTEIDFYAYSKNPKEHIAFPSFYSSNISNLVKGAEYVDYDAEIFGKNQIGDYESEILRNDTIYEIQGNYGNSYIRAINCIEKTDSGFIARRYDYINDSLVYDNTISYMTKTHEVGRPWIYEFIPDVKSNANKEVKNTNPELVDDRGMKGHFEVPKGDFSSISDGVRIYLTDIKYNDNIGKEKVNLPDIEQEPKYTLKYYKDNKYNIQIKYY